MKALILAAGMASRLRPLTEHTPKCLLKIGDKSLLQRSIDALLDAGIDEFVIVTGYLNQQIIQFVNNYYGDRIRVHYIHNALYESTNNIYSLWLARPEVDGTPFLLLDSDLLYDPIIVKKVCQSPDENILTLIRHELGKEEMKVVIDQNGAITEISKTCSPDAAIGESLGIERIGASYSTALYQELENMMNQERLENKFYELAFERLIKKGHTFNVLDVTEHFSCELDTVEDFENAQQRFNS